MLRGLLNGVRVVEVGQFLAGPLCGMYLASLNAEVIKVERPGSGDDARRIGPFEERSGESAYYMSANRGKKSVEIDLRSDAGKESLLRLAASADVLIDNLRPGVMERLGLGYADLRERNRGLIYASISGFGAQHTEHASRPAFDSLLQAAGGLLAVTGPPGGPPCRVGVSVVDYVSGVNAAVGVLAALHQRDAPGGTGEGQRVDTSMLATAVGLCENPVARHSVTGEDPQPEGAAHPVVSPFDAYATADGEASLYIANSNDRHFVNLCEALGRPELHADERFATNTARMSHRAALTAELERTLRSRSTGEWEAALVPLGVPVTAINAISETKRLYPECFVQIDHPTAGTLDFADGATAFDGAYARGFGERAPLLGEHTEEVMDALPPLASTDT